MVSSVPRLANDRSSTDAESAQAMGAYVAVENPLDDWLEEIQEAFEDIDELGGNDPEATWRFLRIVSRAKLPMLGVAAIAAGPLENLLSRHGEPIADWV